MMDDLFGEPPPGIEMLSTPPATMQSAPSERIELAAIAMVCRPDEQKRLTVVPDVVTGQPAHMAALRAMFMPVSASGMPQPRITSSTAPSSMHLVWSIG